MNRAVIGLGSNLQPEYHLQQAQNAIAQKLKVLAASEIVETLPIGLPGQPNFLNGALLIATNLDEDALRTELKTMEIILGRTPAETGFSNRTIDLDLLVWNDAVVHKDFYERDFVQRLVLQLIPEFRLKFENKDG